MFSGIIETIGEVQKIITTGGNQTFVISSELVTELRPDQSLAHNGVCLTVEKVSLEEKTYQVTAIQETLEKSMLGTLAVGDKINLERSLLANGRVDGHFVQGHVDSCGEIVEIERQEGSSEYYIEYPAKFEAWIVSKGSICINGISLTVAKSLPEKHVISVCIIPYTIEHTNISDWKTGDKVNLEFDVLGKYVQKIISLRDGF